MRLFQMLTIPSLIVLHGCGAQNTNQSEALDMQVDASELSDLDVDAVGARGGLDKVIYTYKDSGQVIDGKGKEFNKGKKTMVIFQSVQKDGKWLYPKNIVFKNWKINGALRILGVGPSSDTTLVKESSRKLGHTQRMREAAPRKIFLQNLQITTDEKIPLVFAPGVHLTTLENSVITGKSRSVAIYLDAESGENTIRNNIFNMEASREVIAVDGSADNTISGNVFQLMKKGAVHVYRNSGERGVVRHQEPRRNQIKDNFFVLAGMQAGRAVFLGSRNGTNPNYRHDDAQFDFGSGASNRDFARENTVTGNKASGQKPQFAKYFLKDTEGENTVRANRRVDSIKGVDKTLRKFEKNLEMPDLGKAISAL
jgi:hypothetical protein